MGYFALPDGLLTSLAPGGFWKTPWCRILVSLVRRAPLQEKATSLEFRTRACFRYMENLSSIRYYMSYAAVQKDCGLRKRS